MATYGTNRGLPRYDFNTLQPIRSRYLGYNNDAVITGTLKTFTTRQPLSQDLYNMPQTNLQPLTLEHFDQPNGLGTVRSLRPFSPIRIDPMASPLPPQQVLSPLPTPTANNFPKLAENKHAYKWNWSERLTDNYNLSIHRLFFLTKKLPTLALLAISIFIYFGRANKLSFDLAPQERNLNLVVFVGSIFGLFGSLFGSLNHHNVATKALGQTWIRLAWLAVGLIIEAGVVVLGIVALVNLSGKSYDKTISGKTQFRLEDRYAFVGVELALGGILAALSLLSIYHAVYALVILYKDRRAEVETYRLNIEQAAFVSQLGSIQN